MAKLLGGTRIYGTATVDTILYVGRELNVNGLIYGIPASTPYTTATYLTSYSSSSTPYVPATNTNNRMVITGTLHISVPANNIDGAMIRLWIVASGANRTVTVNTSTVRIPATSANTGTSVVNVNTKSRIAFQYDLDRAKWELVTWIDGY
jgi:hypothetical protein